MNVITENEIDLSVIDTKTAKEQLNKINKHLIINNGSIDIVGDNGVIYASYGEAATLYGGRSSLNLAGDGLNLKSEDGVSVFSVQNNADGASISEKFNGFGGFTSKSFAITKRFKTYSKINILFYDSTYIYEASSTDVSSGSVKLTKSIKGFDRSEESSYTVDWNVSGTTLTVTLSSAIPNTLTYNIEIFGNGEAEANIKFNGCIIDGIIERGVSDSWHYTKWLSGECELYGQFVESLALTTASGNAYSTSGNQTKLLPFSLVGGVAVGNAVDKFTEAVTCHVSGQNLIWRPFRHASSSLALRSYAFIIKGRWKE